MARRLGGVVALGTTITLSLTACSDAPDRAGSGEPTSEAAGTSAAAPDPAGEVTRDIDVGGRSLHLRCWGEPVEGESTVLLLHGAQLSIESWLPMAVDFATEGHHVCAYDRAGSGDSYPPHKQRNTLTDQVADLRSLLDGAGLTEPLVLVAHSAGSLPVIGFAGAAPEQVAGVVMVDALPPRLSIVQEDALPPEEPREPEALVEERRFLTGFRNDPDQNAERLLLSRQEEQASALLDEPGPLFGDAPVVVLQAPLPEPPEGLPADYVELTETTIDEGHAELAAESTDGTLVQVEDTGHHIQTDQPAIVMEAIRDVLAG